MLYLLAFVAGFLFCGGLLSENKAFLAVSLFLVFVGYLREVGKEVRDEEDRPGRKRGGR